MNMVVFKSIVNNMCLKVIETMVTRIKFYILKISSNIGCLYAWQILIVDRVPIQEEYRNTKLLG